MNAELKGLVLEAGMTQAEVAVLLSLSEATVSRMFDGVRELKVSEAALLVDELQRRLGRRRGLTLNDLFESNQKAGTGS